MSDSISTDAGAPFDGLPKNAATHFHLHVLAAVLQICSELSRNLGSDEMAEQFPFLRDYLDELHELGSEDVAFYGATDSWLSLVHLWEESVETHLPVRAIRDALALDAGALTMLFAIGLIEEDPRFGFVLECAQPVTPQQPRVTLGLLTAWWRKGSAVSDVREGLRKLLDGGLVQVLNADAPRLQWMFQTPPAVWDALRGEVPIAPMPWLSFTTSDDLPGMDDLILAPGQHRLVRGVPELLRSGSVRSVVVRGPRHNGRRTVTRAIAKELGRGVLELRTTLATDDARWSLLRTLATLTNALLIIPLELGLSETAELPAVLAADGPIAVVLGKHGAVTGSPVEGAVIITLDVPGLEERRALWSQALEGNERADADTFARQFRLTSGNVKSAAALATSYALLDGRGAITRADVRAGARALHRDIETLATLVPASGRWESIGASGATLAELRSLETRCRNREQLRTTIGESFRQSVNCGVRALFAGPSGTGKTMAARILASVLQMDLYRLNLASTVNKFLGESEKNLENVLSRAEELDVCLLLDEGDSLLTTRTAVQSSNDRWANLETNFLLQRLETFDGILLVTTNAASRIDSAFERRMDVVIDFHPPDAHERWAIWQLHLPAGHEITQSWLQDVAVRCVMTGGEIRNAVVHASLLALDGNRPLGTAHVEEAVHREYRKMGSVCPVPRTYTAGA